VTLLSLYILALLDGILCGLRASMGRCPLIRKRNYYARAAVRGIAGAQMVSILALGALIVADLPSLRSDVLRGDLESSAGRMLWVFLPYTALVLFSLAVRALPSTDMRSATSVFMLGPLTAIRPFVMITGILYGIAGSSLFATRLLGLFILVLMLSLEFALNGLANRGQMLQIRKLV
jgi:hypothetical protein